MTTDNIQLAGAGILEYIKGTKELNNQQKFFIDKADDMLGDLAGNLNDTNDMMDDLIGVVSDTILPGVAVSDNTELPVVNEYIVDSDALMNSDYLPYMPLDKLFGASNADVYPMLITTQMPEYRPDNAVSVDIPYGDNSSYPVSFIPVNKVSKETLITDGITDYVSAANPTSVFNQGSYNGSYYTSSGKIIPSVNDDMTSLQDNMNPVLGIMTTLKKKSSTLANLLSFDTDPESLVDKTRGYYDSIMAQIGKAGEVLATINAIKSMIENFICSICSMFSGLSDFNFTMNLFQGLISALMAIWNMIKSIYDAIKNIILGILSLFDLSMFNLNLNCGCFERLGKIVDAILDDDSGAISETSVAGALDKARNVASAAGVNANVNIGVGGVGVIGGDVLQQSPTGIINSGVNNVGAATVAGLDGVGSFVSNAGNDASALAGIATDNVNKTVDTVSSIPGTVTAKLDSVSESVGTTMAKADRFTDWKPA